MVEKTSAVYCQSGLEWGETHKPVLEVANIAELLKVRDEQLVIATAKGKNIDPSLLKSPSIRNVEHIGTLFAVPWVKHNFSRNLRFRGSAIKLNDRSSEIKLEPIKQGTRCFYPCRTALETFNILGNPHFDSHEWEKLNSSDWEGEIIILAQFHQRLIPFVFRWWLNSLNKLGMKNEDVFTLLKPYGFEEKIIKNWKNSFIDRFWLIDVNKKKLKA